MLRGSRALSAVSAGVTPTYHVCFAGSAVNGAYHYNGTYDGVPMYRYEPSNNGGHLYLRRYTNYSGLGLGTFWFIAYDDGGLNVDIPWYGMVSDSDTPRTCASSGYATMYPRRSFTAVSISELFVDTTK